MNDAIVLQLPKWLPIWHQKHQGCYPSVEDKVRLAIDLARENTQQKTGGPFGAAIFDRNNDLVQIGINLVTSSQYSCLHAEITALFLVQRQFACYDLSPFALTLASSAEPCAMCMGAIPWSGVTTLCYSARDEDIRAIGFDEGIKHPNWRDEYQKRNINVISDVLRNEGQSVLRAYQGTIYNATGNKDN